MLRSSLKVTLILISLVFSDIYSLTRRLQYILDLVALKTQALSLSLSLSIYIYIYIYITQTSQIPPNKMVDARRMNCTFIQIQSFQQDVRRMRDLHHAVCLYNKILRVYFFGQLDERYLWVTHTHTHMVSHGMGR
jgi:hypothetical protein